MNETVAPGKYYLGDPTNVLPTKILIGIWENIYKCKNGKFEINGTHFVVHNTHYGDGNFKDTKNRTYIVEGGMLGLVALNLIENINLCNKSGYIYDFKHPVNFIYDAGLFMIKSKKKYIQIDTRNLDEYDSEIEDSLLNDDGEHVTKTMCNDSDNDSINDENDNYFDEDIDIDEDTEQDNEHKNLKNNNTSNKIGIKFFK